MAGRSATIAAFYLVSLLAGPASAAAGYPRNEAWLGFGGAASFEESIFNTPNDIASIPEAAISLGYMLNLDARRAVGFHLYGGTEMTPATDVQSPAGSGPVPLELDTYNLGMRYRQTFTRGRLVPHAFVGGSLAGVVASGGGLEDLTGSGVSICAGLGASVCFGRRVMLTTEGFGSLGVATWDQSPSTSSSGREFNPSLVGFTVNLGVAWGPYTSAPAPAAEKALAQGSGFTSQPALPSLGSILLTEAVVLLYSSAAYSDEKALLPGLTIAVVLGGASAGATANLKSPKSTWLLLGGMAAIATAEAIMANNGASQDALFTTSMVSWNVVIVAIGLEERKAGRQR